MHYPGHLRDAFLDWVEAGTPPTATVEVSYQPTEVRADEFLASFEGCSDIVPGTYCDLLDLPTGQTYGSVARHLSTQVA